MLPKDVARIKADLAMLEKAAITAPIVSVRCVPY
jgi:hypothetical protein